MKVIVVFVFLLGLVVCFEEDVVFNEIEFFGFS